uniref:Uncharacterized protein n=1 Tax=Tetradesmus obliquus TaxID=3088 RepID=A0A383W1Q3_TETOB|eukprot:jgi/Sobl393_1/947/SZX70596.1
MADALADWEVEAAALMEHDHVYKRTCTGAACQTTGLVLQRSSSGMADTQPGDQTPCQRTVTAVLAAQSLPANNDNTTGSGRNGHINAPNSTSITGGAPTATGSTSPGAVGGRAPASTNPGGSSVPVSPAPRQPSAALLAAAAEAAMDCVRRDAEMLLAALTSPSGTPRSTAGGGITSPAGLKAAALKAAQGSGGSRSSDVQAAGSCCQDAAKSPGSSRRSARAQ